MEGGDGEFANFTLPTLKAFLEARSQNVSSCYTDLTEPKLQALYIFVTVTIMDRDFLIVCMGLTVMIQSFMLNLKNG